MAQSPQTFDIRHRYDATEDHEALYRKAMEKLSEIAPPWGLKGIEIKPFPPMKDLPSNGVSYTREVGAPFKMFSVGFQNRRRKIAPKDHAMHDDMLIGDFNMNHKAVDHSYLVKTVFPCYVEAMGAYCAVIDKYDVLRELQEKNGLNREGPEDSRHVVDAIFNANYWDRELCRRAFGLTPEEVVDRLQGHVAETRILLDGVLVIYSHERIPDDQLALIDGKLRPLLCK
jgi:hypothetical protein